MSKRLIFFLCGGAVFLFFVLFSFIVSKDVLTHFDFNTTVRLQDNISMKFNKIFSFLSDFGKFEVMTIVLLSIFVIARKFLAGVVALAMYVGFHLIELFGKFFVDHPPPPQFMLRTEHIIDFPQFHVRSESSYPSGHSGRALFVTVILAIIIWESKRFSKPVKLALLALLAVYDIAMLVSRVTLGEHWTTDVIGGSILGTGLALITGAFLVSKKSNKKEDLTHEKPEHKKSLFPKYKIEIKKVE